MYAKSPLFRIVNSDDLVGKTNHPGYSFKLLRNFQGSPNAPKTKSRSGSLGMDMEWILCKAHHIHSLRIQTPLIPI